MGDVLLGRQAALDDETQGTVAKSKIQANEGSEDGFVPTFSTQRR